MKKKIFTKVLVLFLLFLPVLGLAAENAENLELKYPTVHEITLTSTSSLEELINYWFSFAFIIAGLIAFASLVIAGVQYMAAAASPAALKSAKSRIIAGFLGLIILLGSWLTFKVVNPKIQILTFEVKSLSTKIVLFSTTTKHIVSFYITPVGKLIEQGKARPLDFSIKDAEKEFGLLVKTDGTPLEVPPTINEVNFKDFPVKSIGFVGKLGENLKVTAFILKNFEGGIVTSTPSRSSRYSSKGMLDANGNVVVKSWSSIDPDWGNIQIMDLATTSEAIQVTLGDDDPRYEQVCGLLPAPIPTSCLVDFKGYPGLSFIIEEIGPGVYVYGEDNQAKRFVDVTDGIMDLTDDGPFFYGTENKIEDHITKIRIQNRAEGAAHDYLLALHEDPLGHDDLRFFFERKERKLPDGSKQVFGNASSTTSTIAKQGVDQYGETHKPSSLQIWELAQDTSVCRRVELCTMQDFHGDCLVYSIEPNEVELQSTSSNKWIATATMPFYYPQDIPDTTTTYAKKQDQSIVEHPDADIAYHINSIKIEGKCVVALFENPRKDAGLCAACDPFNSATRDECEKCWEHGKTGEAQTFETSMPNLRDEEINKCRWKERFYSFKAQSCASAVIVYPIEGGPSSP